MRFSRCAGIWSSRFCRCCRKPLSVGHHDVSYRAVRLFGNAVPGTITASLDLYTRPYGSVGSGGLAPLGPATLVDQFSLGLGGDSGSSSRQRSLTRTRHGRCPFPPVRSESRLARDGPELGRAGVPGSLGRGRSLEWCSLPSHGFADGIFVIAQRGNCSFADKVENIQTRNGVGALIVNNIPAAGAMGMAFPGFTPSIPVISLSYERGQQIMAALNATGTDTTPDLVYIDFAARWDPY